MFRVHEQTRRAWSRFAFLAFALAPTIGIVAWVWLLSRTAHRDQLLAELSRDVGLRVEAESVEHPWADTVRFRTLSVRDPETNEVIARLPTCEIKTDAAGTLVTTPEVELTAAGWRRAKAALLSRLPVTTRATLPLRFGAGRVQLAGDVELHQVVLREEHHAELRRATLAFRQNRDDSTAARITIERAAGETDPWTKAVRYETRGELVSGDTPVLAAIWMNDDARAAWGSARFAGQLRWRDAAAGVSAEVRGTLAGVDLQTTVAAALAQRISGTAILEMAPLSIVEGRLNRWSGSIIASNGSIGTDLLKALEREWGCPLLIKDALQTTAALPFDQLAATIESTPTQTQIRGRCPGQTAGVLLSSGGHAVLNEPTRFGGPAAQMLAVLVPENTPHVPALPSLASWLRWLPEPTPAKSATDAGSRMTSNK